MRPEEFRPIYELEQTYWWYKGMRAITAALLDGFRMPQPGRILDAGCGTGYMLQWLRRRFEAQGVFGADISREGLTYGRKRGEILLAQCSVTQLPFPDGFFDLVTCFDVLDACTVDGAGIALSELARVLRRGGWLFVRVPAFQWLYSDHDRAVSTQHRYSAAELKDLMVQRRMMVQRLTYANTCLFPLAAVRRWVGRSSRLDPESDVRPLPKGLQWLNGPFAKFLGFEAAWFKRFPWRLPFGLSLIAVARKAAD